LKHCRSTATRPPIQPAFRAGGGSHNFELNPARNRRFVATKPPLPQALRACEDRRFAAIGPFLPPAFRVGFHKMQISLQCAFLGPKKNTSFLDQKQFFSLQCLNSTFSRFFVKENAKKTHPDTSEHFY
jgi:hypothetical protein